MTAAAAEAWGGKPSQVAEERPSLGWSRAPHSAWSPGRPCPVPGAHPSQGQGQGPQEATGGLWFPRTRPIRVRPTPSEITRDKGTRLRTVGLAPLTWPVMSHLSPSPTHHHDHIWKDSRLHPGRNPLIHTCLWGWDYHPLPSMPVPSRLKDHCAWRQI